MLIIRDAFGGITRFEQWQESLGMARNVLAARLKSLVAHGIFEARPYCERPKRHEYVLTDKGRELRPVIFHLNDWGSRHIYGGAQQSVEMVHGACGHALEPVTYCAQCDGKLESEDVVLKRNQAASSLAQLFKAEPA